MFDNDPAKRLTLSEVYSNSWVRGKTATKEQIKEVLDIRRSMMKQRIVQISQTAIKGRIGGVFKNRVAFNRVVVRQKKNEDMIKKPCLTETNKIVQEEKKQEIKTDPNFNMTSLN